MTSSRPFNFSAGPATLPEPVLHQVAAEMLDWHGSGMSVMEMSHRGPEFGAILEAAEADLRELLAVPANFRILFMQGGGLGENAIVPLNLQPRRQGGRRRHRLLVAQESPSEARRYADVHVAAGGNGRTDLPTATGSLRDDAAYRARLHQRDHRRRRIPRPARLQRCNDAPLVIDCSSHLASRPIDWTRVGLAFGGAQKNIGPAGVTLVFVRDDLLGHALPICPSAFNYETVAANHSMYNTPPTYAHLRRRPGVPVGQGIRRTPAQRGLAAIEQRNIDKAPPALRRHGRFRLLREPRRRRLPLAHERALLPARREANERFLADAKAAGLLQLKGHKSVGGMRASSTTRCRWKACRRWCPS